MVERQKHEKVLSIKNSQQIECSLLVEVAEQSSKDDEIDVRLGSDDERIKLQ